jgi:hypothetical protein
MGAFAYTQLPLRVGDRSYSPVTALMDPEFLPTLGNPLALGTFFDRTTAPLSDMTAIISPALWTDAFNRDPDVIGRPIAIDGAPYTVRGVLAGDFQFPRSDASYFTKPVDLLVPSSSFPGFPPGSRQWFGIARLKPDVAIAQAQSELQSIAEGLSRNDTTGDVWSVELASLAEATTRQSREPLLVVLGIAVVLLLIASTNLMNLFFSRGVTRLREMSIRRAIGSTTWRLVRLLLMESLLLAIPIDQSLIYVQPLYLAASEQGALPELRRVIVAYGNQIAMESTLEQSLARIFTGLVPTAAAAAPRPAGPAPDAAAARSFGQRAWEIWGRAQDALRRGDWAQYGAEQKRLEEVLRSLSEGTKP